MSEKLYEAIKTKFDAAATLVSTPFAQLFSGEAPPPDEVDVPICVMVPAVETNTEHSFGHTRCEHLFEFHIVDATLELVGAHALLIDAVFDEIQNLTVTGLSILYFKKITGRFAQRTLNRWECVLEYQVLYEVAR